MLYMLDLEISPLLLTFHRTIRLENNEKTYNLPPSLGIFEIFKANDYQCEWEKDAYFIALHPEEAMWVGFQSIEPTALIVGLGDKNVLTSEKLDFELKDGNYISVPPQLWLDGWKPEDGKINQFITTDDPISISVFKTKDPNNMQIYVEKPQVICGDSPTEELEGNSTCCWGMIGGKVKQKILDDPFGKNTWEKKPVKTIKLYLINGDKFCKVTKLTMPPLSKMDEKKWYNLKEAM